MTTGTSECIPVIITTECGSFTVAVDIEAAPVTASNFLRHVNLGLFDGTSFYRVLAPINQCKERVPIDVIQGGFRQDAPAPFPSIEHEPTTVTHLAHNDGTISMARFEPGSANAAFFVCVGDQPELDHGGRRQPDGEGFAAFGQVVAGMDVVRRIWGLAQPDPILGKPIGITNIAIVAARTDAGPYRYSPSLPAEEILDD